MKKLILIIAMIATNAFAHDILDKSFNLGDYYTNFKMSTVGFYNYPTETEVTEPVWCHPDDICDPIVKIIESVELLSVTVRYDNTKVLAEPRHDPLTPQPEFKKVYFHVSDLPVETVENIRKLNKFTFNPFKAKKRMIALNNLVNELFEMTVEELSKEVLFEGFNYCSPTDLEENPFCEPTPYSYTKVVDYKKVTIAVK